MYSPISVVVILERTACSRTMKSHCQLWSVSSTERVPWAQRLASSSCAYSQTPMGGHRSSFGCALLLAHLRHSSYRSPLTTRALCLPEDATDGTMPRTRLEQGREQASDWRPTRPTQRGQITGKHNARDENRVENKAENRGENRAENKRPTGRPTNKALGR